MDLLETVAKGIRESMGMNWHGLSADKKNDYRDYARVAVRLTLEHYTRNISHGMNKAGELRTRDISLGNGMRTTGLGIFETQERVFRDMLSQAISELEAKTEG